MRRQHFGRDAVGDGCSLATLACRLLMKHARAVLEDLVLGVQPPRGCAIVLIERSFNKPSDSNWVATVGPMPTEYNRRYTAKVAELRKTQNRLVAGGESVWSTSNSATAFRNNWPARLDTATRWDCQQTCAAKRSGRCLRADLECRERRLQGQSRRMKLVPSKNNQRWTVICSR